MHTGPTSSCLTVRQLVDRAVQVTGCRSRRHFALQFGLSYRSLSRAYRIRRLPNATRSYLCYLALGGGQPLTSQQLPELSRLTRLVA